MVTSIQVQSWRSYYMKLIQLHVLKVLIHYLVHNLITLNIKLLTLV